MKKTFIPRSYQENLPERSGSQIVVGRKRTVLNAAQIARNARQTGAYLSLEAQDRRMFASRAESVKQAAHLATQQSNQPEMEQLTDPSLRLAVHNEFASMIADANRREHPKAEQVNGLGQAAIDTKAETILNAEVNPILEEALRAIEQSARSSQEILSELRNR